MKLKLYLILYIGTTLFLPDAKGQTKELSNILVKLYDDILFTSSDAERIRLNDSIRIIIDGFASSDSALTYKFSNVRYLGQITSSDGRIRIINWNVLLWDGSNKYYCYIIRKAKGKPNSVYKLKGEHLTDPPETGRHYSVTDWYGALYYSIEPSGKDYILLGYDFSEIRSRKIIDILSFTPEGELVLGKDLFLRENTRRYREILEYSSQSVVSLRFSKPGMIIFDHLAAFSAGEDENTQSTGAGLSFDGYSYKKGLWKFIPGVDARNPKK